jgi:hypothetical protein
LPQLSLAARVVEVIADRGAAIAPRYGSGCLVAGRTVLTAAHVVTDRVGVRVRDPHKVVYEATLDEGFVGDAEGPRPDLALIECAGSTPCRRSVWPRWIVTVRWVIRWSRAMRSVTPSSWR